MRVGQTVVAVNAHPDDEAILMGGTLARASAQGHRVILITATDGDAGPTSANRGEQGASPASPGAGDVLGARRLAELAASAAALGAHEVIDLGYADSGMGPAALPPQGNRARLHTVPIEAAAARVADIAATRGADVLIGYDRAGGYGHRDHVHVHHIARRAAQISGTRRLLEATAPREPILRALAVLDRLRLLGDFDPQQWAGAFTPKAQITHRVDVRDYLPAKRAALQAHVSQAVSEPVDLGTSLADQGSSGASAATRGTGMGGDARTLARVLGLPGPVFTRLLGREFFVEPFRRHPRPSVQRAFDDIVGADIVGAGGGGGT